MDDSEDEDEDVGFVLGGVLVSLVSLVSFLGGMLKSSLRAMMPASD